MARVKQAEKIAQLETQWKRAVADYQNLEKRSRAEKLQFIQMANVGLVGKLLPILDDLERAAKHINDQGLDLVQKQFIEALKNEGLTEIAALNQPFDPNKMECVERIEGENNLVCRVDIKGYMMGEQVVRPARVAVGIKNT